MPLPTTAITIDALVQEFGAFYLNHGQNLSSLFKGLMQPGKTLNLPGIHHIKTNESLWRAANPIIQSMLQGFQIDFTPKGSVDFHPNEIRLQQMKVDLQIVPHLIEESWLGFLNGDSDKIEKWPITKYLMQQVLDSVEQDKELEVAYKGVHQAPTAGTPNNASQVMDGFHVKLQQAAADQQYPLHVVNIPGGGALTAATVFDQVEEFCHALPERYRDRGFYTIKEDTEITTRVDFTNSHIVSLPSMAGTNHMWATLPKNIVHLTKRNLSTAHMDVQKTDRIVKILIDWWEAIGFICNDYVFATAPTVATT